MLIIGNWELTLSIRFGIKAIKFMQNFFLKKCDFAETNLMKKDLINAQVNKTI